MRTAAEKIARAKIEAKKQEAVAEVRRQRAGIVEPPSQIVDQMSIADKLKAIREVFGKFTTTPIENKIRVHIKPDIPDTKLSKIVSKYSEVLHPSEILLIFDNTVLGSGKVGFLLTPYGIWHRNHFSPGEFCKYSDISSVEAKKRYWMLESTVIINGDFKVIVLPERWDVGLALADFLSRFADIDSDEDTVEQFRGVEEMDPVEAYVQQMVASGYDEQTARIYAQNYYAHYYEQQRKGGD
jgi:hypothetical protein